MSQVFFFNFCLATLFAFCILRESSGQAGPQAGLQAHNKFRALHQVGPLTLDPALNDAAQKCAVVYATKRAIDHSCKTPDTGENLYMSWGNNSPDPANTTIAGVQWWYDEVKVYNYQKPPSSRGVYLHFTQLVWKGTKSLGIGVATVNGYTVVVGKYKPQGNMIGGGSDNYQNFRDNVLPAR